MPETVFEEAKRYILERMREVLRTGGDKLPTEKELAEEVFASYATVRLVMSELEQQGYLRKIRGSGTYLLPGAEQLLADAARTRLRLISSPCSANPDLSYGAYLVQELTTCARSNGHRVDLQEVTNHEEFLALLRREAPAGDPVVYLPPTEPFTLRQIGELSRYEQTPVVVIDCEMGNLHISNITTDNRKGGMLAAQALLDCDCRKLTLLLCEPDLRQIRQRVQGFTEIAELAGATVELWDCGVGVNEDRAKLTRRTLNKYLRAGKRPQGVFAVSDAGAISAADTFRDFGIEPGRDVALIGFDGLPAMRKHQPALDSVAQPVQQICDEIFALLTSWRAGTHVQKLLAPQMLSGASLTQTARARV